MSFSPGQIITAQRLNRLQPKKYYAVASGTTTTSGTISGTSIPVTTETDGASAVCWWVAAVYSNSAPMSSNTNVQAKYDLASSGTYALAQFSGSTEKGTVTNIWQTSIASAGSYTFSLVAAITNATLSAYTSLLVEITEVA